MKYDWSELQKAYDSGLSYNGLKQRFGVSSGAIKKAVKRGDLVTRNQKDAYNLWLPTAPKRTHSEKTKKKISEIRIKFLRENPDKVPYLVNHSSKKSYPEELFEKALKATGINNYVYNYQNGIYQYDFAFPELKIDVEIDGGTHATVKVKAIDEKRDVWSTEEGWTVVRFDAWKVKENVSWCVNELMKIINSLSCEFNFQIKNLQTPVKYEKKNYFCKECNAQISEKRSTWCRKCSPKFRVNGVTHKTKINWPKTKELLFRLETTSYSQLGKELGVTDNSVRKRIKNHPND